ncbi:MAG: hypothetical protein QG673_1117 [Pseudomonadota bacterium]|nr:hypothetical protein [Pseudomonadota bacterium]
MAQEFWQLSSDGIVYAKPKGFLKGYYIYPPPYDEESPNDKYQMYLIEESVHLKSIIEPFIYPYFL